MKNLSKYVVVAFVLITVAGVTWAGKPETEAEPASAVENIAALPEVSTEEAQSVEAIEDVGLIDPFSAEIQVNGCCVPDCRADYEQCKDDCDWDPTCIQQTCYPEFVACTGGC